MYHNSRSCRSLRDSRSIEIQLINKNNTDTFDNMATKRNLQEVEHFGSDRCRSRTEHLDVATKECTNLYVKPVSANRHTHSYDKQEATTPSGQTNQVSSRMRTRITYLSKH